jgi:CrcB protein
MNILLIAIGGGLGSIARYLSFELITKSSFAASKFPIATFFVNVVGSLLAGVLYYLVIRDFNNFDPRLKNFLLVGFLGGFTTFSAFSLDFFRLTSAGQNLQAITYALASVIIAILALFFGFYLSKLIFS